VPQDYEQVCQSHASQGSYILALASKSLGRITSDAEISEMTREDCEKDLDLIGLLLFTNMLKPVWLCKANDVVVGIDMFFLRTLNLSLILSSRPDKWCSHCGNPHSQDSAVAISQLKSGGIRPVMITGDTARTAVHIAREVGMLHNASSTGVCADGDGLGSCTLPMGSGFGVFHRNLQLFSAFWPMESGQYGPSPVVRVMQQRETISPRGQ
jgi:hypothetical protein